MLRTPLLFALLSVAFCSAAQDTQYAQFVVKGELDSAQVAVITTELGKLPGVMQARVGRQNRNVVISSMPGVPILQSEVRSITTKLELEIVCFRQGLIRDDRIIFMDEDCHERRSVGNVQD